MVSCQCGYQKEHRVPQTSGRLPRAAKHILQQDVRSPHMAFMLLIALAIFTWTEERITVAAAEPKVLFSKGNITVTEKQGSQTYTVALSDAPTSTVTVTMAENLDLQMDPMALTFSTANFAQVQTVSVTAVDDDTQEISPELLYIMHQSSSQDSHYSKVNEIQQVRSFVDIDHEVHQIKSTVSVINEVQAITLSVDGRDEIQSFETIASTKVGEQVITVSGMHTQEVQTLLTLTDQSGYPWAEVQEVTTAAAQGTIHQEVQEILIEDVNVGLAGNFSLSLGSYSVQTPGIVDIAVGSKRIVTSHDIRCSTNENSNCVRPGDKIFIRGEAYIVAQFGSTRDHIVTENARLGGSVSGVKAFIRATTRMLPLRASPVAVSNAIEEILGAKVNVTKSSQLWHGGALWTITFIESVGDQEAISVNFVHQNAVNPSVSVVEKVNGTEGVSGSFSLDGVSFDSSATAQYMQERLASVGHAVNVTRTGPSSTNAYRWLITFPISSGNVPMLAVGDALLRGTDATVVVREHIQGYSSNDGSFELELDGQKSVPLVYNATADDMKAALNALSPKQQFSVSRTQRPNNNEYAWSITFLKSFGKQEIIRVNDVGLRVGNKKAFVCHNTSIDSVCENLSNMAGNSLGGTFSLGLNSMRTQDIAFNSSASALQDALLQLPLLSLTNVTRNDPKVYGNTYVFQWIIHFQSENDNVPTLDTHSSLTGIGNSVSVVRNAAHNYLGGSFFLKINGETTGALAYNVHQNAVKQALENLKTVSTVTVSRTDIPSLVGGYKWFVTFKGPMREVQTIQTTAQRVDEIQKIETDGSPLNGSFAVAFNGAVSSLIDYNATASAMKNAIELIVTSTDIVVSRQQKGNGAFRWHITFFSGVGDRPELMIAVNQLQGNNASVNVTTLQDGHSAIAGTFRLSFEDTTTSDLHHNVDSATLSSELANLPGVGHVSISRQGPDNQGGYIWTVVFLDALGDLPMLVPISSISGTQALLSITETSKGYLGDIPILSGISSSLSGIGAAIRVCDNGSTSIHCDGKTQAGRAISGSFRLSSGPCAQSACKTPPLSPTILPMDLERKLNSLLTNVDVSVSRSTISRFGATSWSITFLNSTDNIPRNSGTHKILSLNDVSLEGAPSSIDNARIVTGSSGLGGVFNVLINGEETAYLSANISASTLKHEIEALSIVERVDVSRELSNYGIIWNITFISMANAFPSGCSSINRMDIISSMITGTGAQMTAKKIKYGSQCLGGQFTLSYGDLTTTVLPWSASAVEVKASLDELPNVGNVMVTKEMHLSGLIWNVTFVSNGGDISMLHADSSQLTGSNVGVSVSEIMKGRPIFAPASRISVNVVDASSTAGLTFSKNILRISENGNSDTYSIALNTNPDLSHGKSTPHYSVTVDISSTSDVHISPGHLIFGGNNWTSPQEITVVAVNDNIDEGNVTVKVSHAVTSANSFFNGLAVADVDATVEDNDLSRINMSPVSLTLTEGHTSASQVTFTLDSRPNSAVTISCLKSDDVIVSPSSLTFSPENFSQQQVISISAIADNVDEGSPESTYLGLTSSTTDQKYFGNAHNFNISLSISDTDSAKVVFDSQSISVGEGGSSSSYGIALGSKPESTEVTISIPIHSQYIVSPSSMTFSPSTWNSSQYITVSAKDDRIDEGATVEKIVHSVSSSDTYYDTLPAKNLSVSIVENDQARVVLSATSMIVTEGGIGTEYKVYLNSEPRAPVTIAPTTGGGLVSTSVSSLIFLQDNYYIPQKVLVTSTNDDHTAMGIRTEYVLHTAESADANYNGNTVVFSSIKMNVSLVDDDIAGVHLSNHSVSVTEGASSSGYAVTLQSKPTAAVTISMSSHNDIECKPPSVTFSSKNWNASQAIEIVPVDDDIDENVEQIIVTHSSSSSDANYNGATTPFYPVVNEKTRISITDAGADEVQSFKTSASQVVEEQIISLDASSVDEIQTIEITSTAYTHEQQRIRTVIAEVKEVQEITTSCVGRKEIQSVKTVGTDVNEIQRIQTQGIPKYEEQVLSLSAASATSGSFTVRLPSDISPTTISHDATESQMKSKLETLGSINEVTVTRSSLIGHGYAWTITFISAAGQKDVDKLIVRIDGVGGISPSMSVFERVKGFSEIHGSFKIQPLHVPFISLGNAVVTNSSTLALPQNNVTGKAFSKGYIKFQGSIHQVDEYDPASNKILLMAPYNGPTTTLEIFGAPTVSIGASESASTLKERLESIDGLGTVSVTRSAINANGGYEWLITFLSAGGSFQNMHTLIGDLTGNLVQVSSNRVQEGNYLQGFFKLSVCIFDTLLSSQFSVERGSKLIHTTADISNALGINDPLRINGETLHVQSITTNQLNVETAVAGGTLTGLAGYKCTWRNTDLLPSNASASDVKTAIENIPGAGFVSVSEGAQNKQYGGKEWSITFSEMLGNIPILRSDSTSLTGAGKAIIINEVRQGVALAGSFSVAFGDEKTSNIKYDSSNDEVKSALESLDGISLVSVSSSVSEPNIRGRKYFITFSSATGYQSLLRANSVDLVALSGTVGIKRLIPGIKLGGNTEVQTITTSAGNATQPWETLQGDFTLSLSNCTGTCTSKSIPYNANSIQMKDALSQIDGLGTVDVTRSVVQGLGNTFTWSVTFLDFHGNVPLLLHDASGLSGDENIEISVVEKIPGTAIGGSFSLKFNSFETSMLSHDISPLALTRELELLPSIGEIQINSTKEGKHGMQIWDITFLSNHGDHPLLDVGSTSLNTGVSVDITETTRGTSKAEVQNITTTIVPSSEIQTITTSTARLQEVQILRTSGRIVHGIQEVESLSSLKYETQIVSTHISPVYEVQSVSTDTIAVIREVQEIVLSYSDASLPKNTEGSFRLSFRGHTTTPIPAAASASQVQSAINAMPSVETGGVAVSRTGAKWHHGYSWTVTFTNTPGPLPLMTLDTTQLSGNLHENTKIVRLIEGTSPLSGYFQLTFKSQNTAQISYDATAQEMTDALLGIGIHVTVTRSDADNSPLSKNAYEWIITFSSESGDIPMLGYSIAGLTAAHPKVRITELRSGEQLGGVFSLGFNQAWTGFLPFDATSAAVKASLESTSTIGKVSVSRSSTSIYGTFAWTIIFQSNHGDLPQLRVDTSKLSGSNAGVKIVETINGTTRREIQRVTTRANAKVNEVQSITVTSAADNLGGTYRLKFDGVESFSIAHDITAQGLESILKNYDKISHVKVTRNRIDGLSRFGFSWNVTFLGNPGDVSALTPVGDNLQGSDPQIDIKTLTEGLAINGRFQLAFCSFTEIVETASLVHNSNKVTLTQPIQILSGDPVLIDNNVYLIKSIDAKDIYLASSFGGVTQNIASVAICKWNSTRQMESDVTSVQMQSYINEISVAGYVNVSRDGPDNAHGHSWNITFLSNSDHVPLVRINGHDLKGEALSFFATRLSSGSKAISGSFRMAYGNYDVALPLSGASSPGASYVITSQNARAHVHCSDSLRMLGNIYTVDCSQPFNSTHMPIKPSFSGPDAVTDTLMYRQHMTGEIDSQASAGQVKAALEAVNTFGEVDVTRTSDEASLGAHSWAITFKSKDMADLSTLVSNSYYMTGSFFKMDVKEIVKRNVLSGSFTFEACKFDNFLPGQLITLHASGVVKTTSSLSSLLSTGDTIRIEGSNYAVTERNETDIAVSPSFSGRSGSHHGVYCNWAESPSVPANASAEDLKEAFGDIGLQVNVSRSEMGPVQNYSWSITFKKSMGDFVLIKPKPVNLKALHGESLAHVEESVKGNSFGGSFSLRFCTLSSSLFGTANATRDASVLQTSADLSAVLKKGDYLKIGHRYPETFEIASINHETIHMTKPYKGQDLKQTKLYHCSWKTSPQVPYNASELQMQQAIENISNSLKVTVSRSEMSDHEEFKWAISFHDENLSSNIPLLQPTSVRKTGVDSAISVKRSTLGSTIGGTFQLQFCSKLYSITQKLSGSLSAGLGSYVQTSSDLTSEVARRGAIRVGTNIYYVHAYAEFNSTHMPLTLPFTDSSGSEAYKCAPESTSHLPYDSSAAEMKSKLEALSNVGVVNVTRTGPFARGRFSWLVTFATNGGNVPTLNVVSALTGKFSNIVVTEKIRGSEMLGGAIVIRHGGKSSIPILLNSPSNVIEASLMMMETIDKVSVLTAPLGGVNGGRKWTIQFTGERDRGNIEMLRADSQYLSGDGLSVEVKEVRAGNEVGGDFLLNFRGSVSGRIDAKANASAVKKALQDLIPHVEVSRGGPTRANGYSWTVTFNGVHGDIDNIIASSVALTGHQSSLTVSERVKGVQIGGKISMGFCKLHRKIPPGISVSKGSKIATTSHAINTFLSVGDAIKIGARTFHVSELSNAQTIILDNSWPFDSADALPGYICAWEHTQFLKHNITESELQEEIQSLPSVKSVSVSRSTPDNEGGFTWHVTFHDGDGDLVLSTCDSSNLSGAGATCVVHEMRKGYALDTIFKVGFKSDVSTAIPSDATASELKQYIESIPSVGSVDVTRTRLSKYQSFQWDITMTSHPNNIPNAGSGDTESFTAASNNGTLRVSTEPWKDHNGEVSSELIVVIYDNDHAGVRFYTTPANASLREQGRAGSYSMQLNSAPLSPVTVSIAPPVGVQVNPQHVEFSTDSWNVPVYVHMETTQDIVNDTTVLFINHVSTSSDSRYNDFPEMFPHSTIAITVYDKAFVVLPVKSLNITEGGSSASFNLTLGSEPMRLRSELPTPFTLAATNASYNILSGGKEVQKYDPAKFRVGFQETTTFNTSYTRADVQLLERSYSEPSVAAITFDISSIASLCESAKLRLYKIAGGFNGGSYGSSIAVSPLTSLSWTKEHGLIFGNSLNFATLWKRPNEDKSNIPSVHHAIKGPTGNWVEIDITNQINEALEAGKSSIDLVIYPGNPKSEGILFASTEFADASKRPILLGYTANAMVNVSIHHASLCTYTGRCDVQTRSELALANFNVAKWKESQRVTVVAINDDIAEGNIQYSHTTTVLNRINGSDDVDYASLELQPSHNIKINIADNDRAGMTISSAAVSSTEGGTNGTYTIKLDSDPISSVTVTISQNIQVKTVPTVLTFGKTSWNIPQQVTAIAINDEVDESTEEHRLTHTLSSDDKHYNNLSESKFSHNQNYVLATIIDDDLSEVILSKSSMTVTEGGLSATYSVSLRSDPDTSFGANEPQHRVTVAITPFHDVHIGETSLTFTSSNWNTPQQVSVSAVNDHVDEDSTEEHTLSHASSSITSTYMNAPFSPVSSGNMNIFVVDDGDSAGVVLSNTSGMVRENGDGQGYTFQYSIKLRSNPDISHGQSAPLYAVTVAVAIDPAMNSHGDSDMSVTPSSLTYSASNWDTAQYVEVSAYDDIFTENIENFKIKHSAISNSLKYHESTSIFLPSSVIDIQVNSDDLAGAILNPSNISCIEGGTNSTYSVVLTSKPHYSTVTVFCAGNSQISVEPASLTFGMDNWNSAQFVAVTAINDVIDEVNALENVVHSVRSGDAFYDNVGIRNMPVNVRDDDTAAIMIQKSRVHVREGGSSSNYILNLASQPTSSVTISALSSDQFSVSPNSITFSESNWESQQTVTVSAIVDSISETVQLYQMLHTAASDDFFYNDAKLPKFPSDIQVTVYDRASVNILPAVTNMSEGSSSANIAVTLGSQPMSTSTNGSQSVIPCIAGSSVFQGNPSTKYNLEKELYVSSMENSVKISFVKFPIHSLAAFAESANLQLHYINGGKNDNMGGGGVAAKLIDPTSLDVNDITFENPLLKKFVNVSHPYDTSIGGHLNTSAVSVRILPRQNLGFLHFDVTDAINAALRVSESEVIFALWPLTQVSSDITFSSGNALSEQLRPRIFAKATNAMVSLQAFDRNMCNYLNQCKSQVALPLPQLSFSGLDWMNTKNIKIDAIDDSISEMNDFHSIIVSFGSLFSTDNDYASEDVFYPSANASVNIFDNDAANILISKLYVNVKEGGFTDIYELVLSSQPISPVTISITGTGNVETSPTSIVFSENAWNTAQTVTVVATNDTIDEHLTQFAITHTASSLDKKYNAEKAAFLAQNASSTVRSHSLFANVYDNDVAFVSISEHSITIEEGKSSHPYSLVLNTEPTQPVTIAVSADADIELSMMSCTFTPTDWNVPQIISVLAINDDVDEINEQHTLTHTSSSSDPFYNGGAIPFSHSGAVTVNILDNDIAGITLSALSVNATEGGMSGSYSIVINSDPDLSHGLESDKYQVLVSLETSSDVSLSKSVVTFTASNWNSPQSITVTAVNDDVDESDVEIHHIKHMSIQQVSSGYNGNGVSITNGGNVAALIHDDADTVGFSISKSELIVSESGKTDSYQISLTSDPDITHNSTQHGSEPNYRVTILVSANSNDDMQADKSSLTFTSIDWSVPQTVTVSSVQDSIDEIESETHQIVHVAHSQNAMYHLHSIAAILTRVEDDDDTAQILIDCASQANTSCAMEDGQPLVSTIEGSAGSSYSLVLKSQPLYAVTVATQFDGNWITYVEETFDNGVQGWGGSALSAQLAVSKCGRFGSVLGGHNVLGGGGSRISKVFSFNNVPHTSLRLRLDFLKIDSWNNESAFIYIDGTPVNSGAGAQWQERLIYGQGTQECGKAFGNWYEYVSHVDITVPHSVNTAKITVLTTLDESAQNEAWGIDNVTVSLLTNEMYLSTSHLTFSPQNWNSLQTITASPIDDFESENTETLTISHRSWSSDSNYNAGNVVRSPNMTLGSFLSSQKPINNAMVKINDNDKAMINIAQTNVPSQYTMELNSEPTAIVTVSIASSTFLSVSPSIIVFNRLNWGSPHSFTVHKSGNPQQPGLGMAVETTDPFYFPKTLQFNRSQFVVDGSNLGVTFGGIFSFSDLLYNVSESSPSVSVNIHRNGGSLGNATVCYQTGDGTASANNDYTSVSGCIEFGDGETRKSLHVPILNDNIFEIPDESFDIMLLNTSGETFLGRNIASVRIVDDFDAGCVQFANAIHNISESGGSIVIPVVRGEKSSGILSVNYSSSSALRASAGLDYEPANGRLVFQEGETMKYITLKIFNDTYIENPDEQVKISLSAALQSQKNGTATGPGCIGTAQIQNQNAVTIVTIIDDGDLNWTDLSSQLDAVNDWEKATFSLIRD